MIRPIIKKGDSVRFRTDGEVGELNRLLHYGEIIKEPYTVTEVLHDGMIQLSLSRMKYYSPIQFDICNDFSNVQIGDKIEYVGLPSGEVEEATVTHVGDLIMARFMFDLDSYAYIAPNMPCAKFLRIKKAPLLAGANPGDLCKCRNGKWVQYDKSLKDSLPYLYIIDGNYCAHDGKFRESLIDIIEWQPLAPEGSAEWAKQMMLLGRVISRTNNNDQWKLEFDSVYRYCIKNAKWLLEADIKCWTDLVIDTGWKIYEPKPKKEEKPMVMKIPPDFIPFHMHVQPTKFEVGQLVEYNEGVYTIENVYSDTSRHCRLMSVTDGLYETNVELACLTPIPAENVVLDFGNGIKGEIGRNKYVESAISVFDSDGNGIAGIMMHTLTEPMRTIVEAVLARQEIEEEK
jgi:hypothetical protein